MAEEVVAAAAVIPSTPVADPAAVLVPTGTVDPTPAVAPAPTVTSALEDRIAELTAKVNAVLEAKAVVGTPIVVPAAPVVDTKPCVAFRAWLATKNAALSGWTFMGCANRFISGARTMLVFGVTGAIGLADSFNGIDLSGLAEQYLGTKVKVGDLVTLMAVAGILLRLMTKTPVFTRWQKTTGVDGVAGAVDEPAA